jgi:BclB C-terminal domain-containing protein
VTSVGGLANTSSAIGFGGTLTGLSALGGTIDMSQVATLAFSMPRDGTITSLAGYMSIIASIGLLNTDITVTAQLFQSTTPNDTFTAIPGAVVTFPVLTGSISVGDTISAETTGLNIAVDIGTRLILVFSAAVTSGIDLATSVIGYASAGVAIS